jgi:hypothetical protein
VLGRNQGDPIRSSRDFISRLRGVWLHCHFPADIDSLVRQVVLDHADQSLYAAAETAANGFVIPEEAVTNDVRDLESVGSITELISSRQQQQAASRFNVFRCRQWFTGDEEWDNLFKLASTGAVIDVSLDFTPTTIPETPRPLLLKLQHTFSKHAYDLWKKGQALLLTLDAALASGLHFNPVHWTSKPGKPEGRFLCDLSNAEAGCVINDDSAKPMIDQRYGSVALPTIQEIVDNILRVAESAGGLHNVRLWKEDIVGAFNQFNFAPNSARWLAFHIEDNVVLILFTGVFGWQGSPAVWAVFSRALLRAASRRSQGLIVVYVDDFIGISTADFAMEDQSALQKLVFGVFGPDAINLDKSVLPCVKCDCIGWTIDLPLSVLYPNEKGIRKLVAAFFSLDMKSKIPQKKWQRLASLAERYSAGILGARPFVRSLHIAAAHVAPSHTTSETKMCIVVWRALALILLTNPLSLAVPLAWISSTGYHRFKYHVVTDAGPLGLGILIFDCAGNAITFASYRFPFEKRAPNIDVVKESRFQNVREFMGVLLTLVCVNKLSSEPCQIMWINDNMSALSWVKEDMTTSIGARWAFLAHTWFSILGHVSVTQVEHIPGIDMGAVDKLSRFNPTPELSNIPDWSNELPTVLLDKLFLLCDPSAEFSTDSGGKAIFLPWEQSVVNIIDTVKRCLTEW